jgi:hypothetical protein
MLQAATPHYAGDCRYAAYRIPEPVAAANIFVNLRKDADTYVKSCTNY